MKTNDPHFNFLQIHPLTFLAATLFVCSSVVQTAAQPGGCYDYTWRTEYCREQRNKLLEKYALEIDNLTKQIAREPKRAELYYNRGQAYSALLLSYFHATDVKFDGKVYFADIDAQAIADYSRAIQLAPRVEYFVERGKIYSFLWMGEKKDFQYHPNSEESVDGDEIRQAIDKSFIYNERFQAAEKDFLKAIELSNGHEAAKVAREQLFSLRGVRANSLSINPYVAKLIGAEKPGDIALEAFDYGVYFYKSYNRNNKLSDTLINMLYGQWIRKGEAAKRFGRDDIALEAFNEAEKVQLKNSYPECLLYRYRAEIFVKRSNFEAALKDVTFAIDNNLNCKRMNELRGDIYWLKGDLNAAVESYSAILNDPYGFNRDFYWKRGKVYLQLGDPQKAIADFTSAIGISTLCEEDYKLRAEAYRLAGDTQAAEADEERVQQTLKDQKSFRPTDYCYYHRQ
jgi:tetratricopeptide (TPR) repeat protein